MYVRPVLLTTLLVMITFGSGLSKALAGNATALFFVEQERRAVPRNTRVIVTSKYVPIDDGEDAGDFLLFDRAKRSIFVTNSLDKRILVINARPLELPPPTPFEHRTETGGEGYPDVAGRKVIHYRLFTNSEKCLDGCAAADLLTDAQQALKEYRRALVGEHAVTAQYSPTEFRSVRDLANNIFLPARHLESGFPVRQRDMAGARRQLLDYKTGVDVAPGLFALPRDYRRFTLNDMRVR